MNTDYLIAGIALALALWALWEHFSERVTVWDYQTALHYKHGQYVENLSPGVHRLWGRGHDIVLSENRISEMVIQSQELITADSATLKVSAVLQYRISDARRYHEGAQDSSQALYTQGQLALREVLSGLTLDEVLAQKSTLSKRLVDAVQTDAITEAIGVQVQRVVVRDLMLGSELKTAYASVLTSRKEAQAKLEDARGEAAALRTMANAARVFENNPELLRLRYLETLKEAGAAYGNTLIVGLPDEFSQLAAMKTGPTKP